MLNPASGAFAPLTDSASLSANWASGNPSNPTALSAGPVDNTITAKSIAVQKSVQDLSNTVDIQPGDTLQYTLNGQVSNYFDLNTLVQTDVLGDGQTFLSSFTPTITIDELGQTVYSGVVATSEYTVSAKAADGTSTVTFNISKILTDHGQPGDLNGGTAANPQPATTTLVFETTIDKTYSENPAPPVSTLVNQGDTISDTVTYSGDVAGTGDQVSDGSSASVALPTNTVKKSIYAVNGVRVTGPVTLQAGDTVTYDLQLTTPLTSTQDVTLTDFLPEPVLSAADPKANGSTTGFTFVDTKSAAAPAAGVAKFGPADTFMATIPGDVPTISTNATANSLSFNLGNYTFNPAYPTNVADILYTVTVGDQPFADGLLLTNQVTSSETNSFGTVSQANSIVQLTLGEPVLSVQKGSIATSDPKAVFSGSEGPTGAITDTSLAANPLNDSLSGIVGGDTVTFRVIVQNTGSGPNGAFDVVLNDTLPSGFINPTNITVTNGAGQALAYTNVGGGLFDPAGGIQLTDNGSNGALSSDSATSGGNIAVITYTATAAPGVPVPGYDLQNTATVTHYAAEAGGVNDTSTSTPTALSASTNVYTATPDFAKGVISTSQHSPTSGSNNLADLAIGEQFTYDLTVTLTKGTANDVTVTDPLPAGVTLLGYSVHVGSDITGAYVQSSPASPSFPYDGTISFNFGNLTDNSNAQGVNDQVVIALTAEVVDTTGNAGGTQLINTGTLTETNPNDPAGTPYTQSASATETVVEPNLSLTKTASTAAAQAGDVVTYTLHYVNAAGAASAAAYSSVISDALDQLGADATFNAGSVKVLSGTTASGVSITQGNTAGDTAVAVNVAEIDPGQAVDLSYSVTLTPSAVSGDVLPNVATYSAGTLANGDPAERTESGAGTADVTVQQASISKAMIAGSDPNIPVGKLAVGETGTYQIVVAVPHGVAPDAFITDSLPAGLDDLQIQSVVLGSNVTTTQQSVISNASAFSINLGTVTDSGAGATTAADDITVTYTAIADTAPSNLPGAVDTNTAQFASVNYSVTATANTDIVAPDVTISKADNVTSVVAGQDITYTVTLHNIGSSPAYDESVTDALPLDATFVAGSLTATNGATASITGGTISVTDAALAANGTVTVTYQATANADVTPGETLSNTATERYASQPTGGQTYTGSSTAAVPVVLPPSDVKTIAALSNSFSTSNVITGETITYQIVGTLSPGQQAVELTDALPLGLSLVSETVTSVGSGLTGISTGAVTPNGAGTVVFSDVTAAAGGADSFTVDVVAKVGLVSGGTQFSNTATIGVSAPGTTTPVSSASSTAPALTDVKSSLSGTVFIDHNDDGVENGTDAGKGGVVAELLNSTGSLVATTTTASNGTYSFAGLEAGTYSVKFVAPSGYVFDTVQGSGNAAADSIVSTAGKTAPVTLAPGASTPNQNAGLYQPVSFSGTVFQDQNADGSQQSGDTGVSGDTVTLYQTGSTTPVATTTTGTNGAYSFTGLAPGSYDAVISPVGTESFSPKGTSGASPNSVVSATGTTPTTTLQSGQSATAQDAGVYGPGSLSGTVFTDNNDDGVLDGTDAGQSGVTAELEQAGTVVATTTTGANGAYSFGGLTPGAYSVQVVAPTGEDFSSTPGANPNAALDSIVNTSGATVPVAVTSLTNTPNQNAGLYAPVTVSGDVFTDQNANGVQDTGDTGKSGITVDLTTAGGTAVASTTTDANGDYSFTGLMPGDYTVTVVPPAGYDISPAASGNPAKDSVVDPTTGQVTTGPLLSGQSSRPACRASPSSTITATASKTARTPQLRA